MATSNLPPPSFDEPLDAAASRPPAQSAAGESFLQRSSHPTVMVFHLLFKCLAVASYLLLTWFTDNFILIFVITVLMLSFDFWTVKNVSGRLLVGLRWWNEVHEDGSNVWIFESRPDKSINVTDSRVFWYSLYITPAVWILFGVLCLLQLQISWLAVVAVAISLNVANLVGYTKCERDARKKASEAAASGGLGSTFTSILATSLMDRARSMI